MKQYNTFPAIFRSKIGMGYINFEFGLSCYIPFLVVVQVISPFLQFNIFPVYQIASVFQNWNLRDKKSLQNGVSNLEEKLTQKLFFDEYFVYGTVPE